MRNAVWVWGIWCGCEQHSGPLDREVLVDSHIAGASVRNMAAHWTERFLYLQCWCGFEERGAGVRNMALHLTVRLL